MRSAAVTNSSAEMETIHSEADFEDLSWHDCCLHGVELCTGDPSSGDWTHDLALDIDFIVEWPPCGAVPAEFLLAPATLKFHRVTDLHIGIDWPDTGYRVALHPASIDRIDREPAVAEGVSPHGGHYAWTIHLNWPADGVIRFGAYGFTQRLRREPVQSESQRLSSIQGRV